MVVKLRPSILLIDTRSAQFVASLVNEYFCAQIKREQYI